MNIDPIAFSVFNLEIRWYGIITAVSLVIGFIVVYFIAKFRIKKPDEVYLAIYQEAKRKAKEAKRNAIQAYLEVKRIKKKYSWKQIAQKTIDVYQKIL